MCLELFGCSFSVHWYFYKLCLAAVFKLYLCEAPWASFKADFSISVYVIIIIIITQLFRSNSSPPKNVRRHSFREREHKLKITSKYNFLCFYSGLWSSKNDCAVDWIRKLVVLLVLSQSNLKLPISRFESALFVCCFGECLLGGKLASSWQHQKPSGLCIWTV